MRTRIYRQGDIMLVATNTIPEEQKLRKRRNVTVAEGEVTGHHHVLEAPTECAVFADVDVAFIRIMGANGLLTHPEHATIEVPPGDYRVRRQREYSPEAIRNVQD